MSKERLEEIKEQLEESNSYDDNPNGYWYHNINWLIEQAERVQELERKLDRVRFVNDIFLEKEKQQNQRYREAIFKALDALPVGFKNDAVRILGEALEGEKND